MQTYRISLKKEGTPWELFLILYRPLHLTVFYYRSQGKKLNGKDCRCPPLEAVHAVYQLSIINSTLFSRLRKLRIFMLSFISVQHPRLSFPLLDNIINVSSWDLDQSHNRSCSHEFALCPNLRPSASLFGNEIKFRTAFHLNSVKLKFLKPLTTRLSKLTFFPLNYLISRF